MSESIARVPTVRLPIKVLLLEDDPSVVETIRNGLARDKFVIRHASSVSAARQLMESRDYDAAVLDLNLPDGHGFEIADALRETDKSVAILMLTVKSSVDQRIDGFRHGADDYLCKPFAVEELAARLEAVVGRSRRQHQHVLEFADLEIDLMRRTLRRRGFVETLSSREMDLLVYLIRHAGEILERDRILEEVWGIDAEEESNVVNVYVNYLRNKLERGTHPRLIHTVRGIGYVLSKSDPQSLAREQESSARKPSVR